MVGPGAVPLVQPTVNANINNYQVILQSWTCIGTLETGAA